MKKITFYFLNFLLLISLKVIAQVPANDTPCGAIELTVDLGGNCTYNTITFNGEETDSGIPDPGCASYVGGDLWYTVTVPSTGAVTIETNQDSFAGPSSIDDGGMAIYTGDCNNLMLYECNDDGNTALAQFERITYVGTASEVIFIRLWQNGATGAGTHRICTYAVDPPLTATNDDCNTAITLNLNTTCEPIIGTNFGATSSNVTVASDPSCAFYQGDDVWFKILVPNDRNYDIAVETYEDDLSITDGGMAIYSENTPGDCTLGLTEISCDDDSGVITNEFFERIELSGRRNETLYVRIWSLDNAETGTFNICATDISTLSNNDVLFNDFVLYPNPAKDIVNLKFNQILNNEINITLFNLQGKEILNTTKQLQNKSTSLDISSIKSGLYFLKINDSEHVVTKKLIVN